MVQAFKLIKIFAPFLIYLRPTDHEIFYLQEFCQLGLPPQSWEERRQMSTLQLPNNIGSQLFCKKTKQHFQKLEMWRTFTLVQYAWHEVCLQLQTIQDCLHLNVKLFTGIMMRGFAVPIFCIECIVNRMHAL